MRPDPPFALPSVVGMKEWALVHVQHPGRVLTDNEMH